MKAASLSGGAPVNFRAHKELAKGARGLPKAQATVSPTRGARPTDRRGEIAAAARSSGKPRAKLASSKSISPPRAKLASSKLASSLPLSTPARRSSGRPTNGKQVDSQQMGGKPKLSSSEPARTPVGRTAAPVAPQLLEALARSTARVVGLFRAWDDDGTGHISRREFRRGLREMKFDAQAEVPDALQPPLAKPYRSVPRPSLPPHRLAPHLAVGGRAV